MTRKQLCEHCDGIPFHLLRYPRISEIPLIKAGTLPNKFPYIENADLRLSRYDLGYLDEMRHRTTCGLCTYIWKSLNRLDIYTPEGRTRAGGRIICRADVGKAESIFRYPDPDSDDFFKLFQLAVTTHIEGHPKHGPNGTLHVYFDRHFQPCDIGASNRQHEGNSFGSGLDPNMTIFGGRSRPLQIDLRWVRRWLQICKEDHGSTCEALLSPADTFM